MLKIFFLFLFIIPQQALCRPAGNNLPGTIAIWSFDNASGLTVTSTNGKYVLTPNIGAVQWVNGKYNDGAREIGTGWYMNLTGGTATDFDFTTAFTISCHVKFSKSQTTADGYEGALIAKNQSGTYNGYMLWWNDGYIRLYINAGARISYALDPKFEKWYHFAGRWDGENLALFVNGKLYQEVKYNTAPVSSAGTFRLSGYCDGYGIHGILDNVHISSRALSAPEIAQIAGDNYAN